jgi:hypothetical protein
MKFDFSVITTPLLDENNKNIINGFLPDGSKIKVERRLTGYSWEIQLTISVNGTIFHDAPIENDEMINYNSLRESALNYQGNIEDDRRRRNRKIAKYYLLDGYCPTGECIKF